MKYYIIAGEASGDLHASNLMGELKKLDKDAQFRYWGGDLMASQGGEQVAHYRDTAFMGVFEVVINLGKIFKNFRRCEFDIKQYQPDVVILVDYPGFNLRMAKFAKKNGIKVFYYIAPKIWAWNRSRVRRIKRFVDKVFSILPFEVDFYKKYGVEAIYSGSPLLDSLAQRPNKDEGFDSFIKRNKLENKPIIAVLAGSRMQEIDRLLPDMLSVVPHFSEFQFVIAGAPSFQHSDYEPYINKLENVHVLFNETYGLLSNSYASMITSGTATLEAGLLRCPQVVCYKMWGGRFTDIVSKKIIIKVPFISLVNLILERESVKELFQSTFSREKLKEELQKLCYDKDYRGHLLSDYDELGAIMGGPGSSKKTALYMWEALVNTN